MHSPMACPRPVEEGLGRAGEALVQGKGPTRRPRSVGGRVNFGERSVGLIGPGAMCGVLQQFKPMVTTAIGSRQGSWRRVDVGAEGCGQCPGPPAKGMAHYRTGTFTAEKARCFTL